MNLDEMKAHLDGMWGCVLGMREAQYVFARDLVEAEEMYGQDHYIVKQHRDALALIGSKLEVSHLAFFRARTAYKKMHDEAHEHGHGHAH